MKRLIEGTPDVFTTNNGYTVYMYPEKDAPHHNPHVQVIGGDYDFRIEIPFDLSQKCSVFKEDIAQNKKLPKKTVEALLFYCDGNHRKLLQMWESGNIQNICTIKI